MIVTRLMGGLGNQLFQYAAGRSLAARLGAELILDPSRIGGKAGAAPRVVRSYELGCFEHGTRVVDASRVARLWPMTRAQFHARRLLPRSGRPELKPLVQADAPEIDSRIFEAPDNTCLIGNWESERYFVEHADTVRRELRFGQPSAAVDRYAPTLQEGVTVSLHVRGGDKRTNGAASTFWASLPASWYVQALDVLVRHVGAVGTVHVFSDDPSWCRDNLRLPLPTTLVEGNSSADDLRLMSMCHHHVIANSTFSWWGAWLNPRPDKTVVAPTRWRNDRPTIDVVPPGWLQVPN